MIRRAAVARNKVASAIVPTLRAYLDAHPHEDPLNGRLFDLFGGYRPLFIMVVEYTVPACLAVLFVPRSAGEADTSPSIRPGDEFGAADRVAESIRLS